MSINFSNCADHPRLTKSSPPVTENSPFSLFAFLTKKLSQGELFTQSTPCLPVITKEASIATHNPNDSFVEKDFRMPSQSIKRKFVSSSDFDNQFNNSSQNKQKTLAIEELPPENIQKKEAATLVSTFEIDFEVDDDNFDKLIEEAQNVGVPGFNCTKFDQLRKYTFPKANNLSHEQLLSLAREVQTFGSSQSIDLKKFTLFYNTTLAPCLSHKQMKQEMCSLLGIQYVQQP